VVSLAVADGVAVVTVDNPPINALDDPTLAGLTDAAREIAGDAGVRAVVLAGAGERVFLAGADLRALRGALGPHGEPGALQRHVALTRPMFEAWRALAPPVVAALNGNAVGGGLEVALTCDLIVADARARLGLPEVTLGLMPGGGGTQRLARRVGAAVAFELVLLGGLIDAARARELGLVNAVAAEGRAVADALALAARLAALPAGALQAAKRALRLGLDAGLDEGLDAERDLFLRVGAGADAREGADAFLDKRAPRFRSGGSE
jgi:enoyl-CoA hydratase